MATRLLAFLACTALLVLMRTHADPDWERAPTRPL